LEQQGAAAKSFSRALLAKSTEFLELLEYALMVEAG